MQMQGLALMTAAETLRPLPGRKGPFIGIRESLAYLRDPDRFIAERTARYGPVFGTTLFFRPTAVVGGVEAVETFLAQERAISESSLRSRADIHRAIAAGVNAVLIGTAVLQAEDLRALVAEWTIL